MTIPEILKELEFVTGQFPKVAMQAAIEQREAITPELLRALETVAEDPAKWAGHTDYMTHLYSVFLLAQFREKRAYPLLARMVSAPGEIPFDLFGDTITEDLCQLLGSVYDGNPSILEKLVESPEVNEYVRGSAIEAFLVLEKTGQMPREQVVGYFRSLFESRLERVPHHVWEALVCAVADMPAPELLDHARRAFEDDLIDPIYGDFEEVEQCVRNPEGVLTERYYIIEDAISELEWWACFKPDQEDEGDEGDDDYFDDEGPMPGDEPLPALELFSDTAPYAPAPYYAEDEAPKPFIRGPKIGRNDPCPCGSGKKYKKCCGA